MDKALECIENVNKVMNDIKKNFEQLRDMLAKHDLSEQDLLHYVELNSISDEESISLIRLLKSIRQSRRDVKNEFEVFNLLKKSFFDDLKWNKVKTPWIG